MADLFIAESSGRRDNVTLHEKVQQELWHFNIKLYSKILIIPDDV